LNNIVFLVIADHYIDTKQLFTFFARRKQQICILDLYENPLYDDAALRNECRVSLMYQ